MKSTKLKKLKKHLSQWYHLDWEQDNIISVQLEPDSFILAFLLDDPENPDGIILSCALDFDDSFTIAHLAIECCKTERIVLGEGYFISNDKRILWGEEAYHRMQFEKLPANVVKNDSKLLN